LVSSASQTQFIYCLTERLDLFWKQTFKRKFSSAPNVRRWPVSAAQAMKFTRDHPTAACDPFWSFYKAFERESVSVAVTPLRWKPTVSRQVIIQLQPCVLMVSKAMKLGGDAIWVIEASRH
jgi:hypothetical protein